MAHDSNGLSDRVSRRKFIATTGATGIAAIAGCSEGGSSGGSDGESGDGSSGDGGSTDGGSTEEESTETATEQSLSGEINITGSSTVFPLATAVAEEFQKMHSGVDISVQSTGSGGGFENFFCPGESDINNASRPIKDSETQNCNSNNVNPHEIKVATDALTVIINNENDWATEMTVDELAQIWGPEAGSGQTWADINSDWPDEEIERFGAAETSGTFDYFTEVINGEEGAHTQDYEPTEQDRTIVQGVTGSQYAIGYLGFAYYSQNPDQVTAVAVDNGNGPVKPTLETAKSGEYAPLSRPLFTYPAMSALSEQHIAEFCRYFVEQSANTELVANQVGYVPNSQEEMQTELDELNSAIEEANS
ncbi:phosphate ABC transporter substrate-binding protein, PhoT family [Haloarcula vallismortis]|uniref:Phosphate ABC transporter substrate-binding protein n=2 Tax=Haloarcula vallismortis TaxID=28442 RepID=M0JTK4_HALVA|nr:PstS family phosphate ABC transporter substrate-binding protein [Haloarcula vallismortis]EMA11304.1 phosphate ABC transporter substrate-binding protein [Haloarcula vallismortis ATCC 29715]SDW37419.1 phosphate ABC transporter substrate-binding protein, PhoT family [Haloarcula vallismortis]